MFVDENIFITEDEFKELEESVKWAYALSLEKIIKQLKPKAEKNCAECEKNYISAQDLNIDYLFEDWRECRNNCANCSIEDQRYMCQVQFQILNHLSQSLLDLKNQHRAIVQMIFRKDSKGSELLSRIENDLDKEDEEEKESKGIYS
mgnify:CR=1 FL=1